MDNREEFDLQGLVQVSMSTDIPSHKRIVIDAVAEIERLRADNNHQRERRNAARNCIKKMGDGSAWLLRKQAEAVYEALKSVTHYQMDNMDDAIEAEDIKDYADSLGQQADESENE